MTDARGIVERDHIKETTETLFRIAINATMPKENEAKWCQALQYAGAMLEKQQADLASLRKQLEDAREALRQIRDCTTEHGGAAKALRIINEALEGKS